jgi:anti-sigma factor RsiW
MAGAMVSLGFVGCASTGAKNTRQRVVEQESVVTVVSIDVPQRLVTVRDATGEVLTMRVDEANKAFPQAKVGDQVRIRYKESIAVRLQKPGEAAVGLQVSDATNRPEAGRPSADTMTEVKATVRIDDVEKHGSVVSFTGPRGPRTIAVADASMRDFVKRLRPGDMVEVTYQEAVALSLEPVKK